MTTKTNTTKQASKQAKSAKPQVTENPDGTYRLHGKLAKRAIAAAEARGITLQEFSQLAVVHFMALQKEQPMFEQAIHDDKLPIYLEADTVRFLREVSEAGGITSDEFAEGVLGDIVIGSLAGTGDTESLVLDLWQHDNKESAVAAMQAVVDRWKAKQAATA